jgi:hypothetical protein
MQHEIDFARISPAAAWTAAKDVDGDA